MTTHFIHKGALQNRLYLHPRQCVEKAIQKNGRTVRLLQKGIGMRSYSGAWGAILAKFGIAAKVSMQGEKPIYVNIKSFVKYQLRLSFVSDSLPKKCPDDKSSVETWAAYIVALELSFQTMAERAHALYLIQKRKGLTFAPCPFIPQGVKEEEKPKLVQRLYQKRLTDCRNDAKKNKGFLNFRPPNTP